MSNEQRRDGATVGEAVGLVAADAHAATVAALDRAERDATRRAGELAAVAEALYGGEEAAARAGYAGLVARARALGALEAEVPALRQAAADATATKDLAVREAVTAKGATLARDREIARLTAANADLTAAGEHLRSRGAESWQALKAAREDRTAAIKRADGYQQAMDALLSQLEAIGALLLGPASADVPALLDAAVAATDPDAAAKRAALAAVAEAGRAPLEDAKPALPSIPSDASGTVG
jgi:hypothetical protein